MCLSFRDDQALGAPIPDGVDAAVTFLKPIDEQTPAALDLHVIVDNYATHKHDKVKR